MLCISLGHAGNLGGARWLILALCVYSPSENTGRNCKSLQYGILFKLFYFLLEFPEFINFPVTKSLINTRERVLIGCYIHTVAYMKNQLT